MDMVIALPTSWVEAYLDVIDAAEDYLGHHGVKVVKPLARRMNEKELKDWARMIREEVSRDGLVGAVRKGE